MMEKGNDVITIDKSFFENVSNVLDKARKTPKLRLIFLWYMLIMKLEKSS